MVSIQDLLLPLPASAHSPGTTTDPSISSNRRRREPVDIPNSGSQNPPVVIDLTDSPPQMSSDSFEPPPPINTSSRHREIIDLDAEPNYPPFPPSIPHPRIVPSRRRFTHLPSEDITRNHDVIMLGEENIPPSSSHRIPSILNMLRTQFMGESPVTHLHYHILGQFQPPTSLNYGLNAQHVFDSGTPLRDHPGFKDDAYRAPSAAREGFTRSPTENMTLICPQCGDELGRNADVLKREVWVAKCGHTYCGECAFSHRQNKAKGQKATRCIVDGCTRIISGDRAMIEVFLGE